MNSNTVRRGVLFPVLMAVIAGGLLVAATPQETAPQAPAAPDTPTNEVPVAVTQPFDAWLGAFLDEARDRGYKPDLLGQTVEGLEPLPRVLQADRSQAELNPGFARYVSTRVTTSMVRRGQAQARTHQRTLAAIERKYGVQRRFVLAIWGIETQYGRLTGRTPVFRALATLAWEPRRADYFRNELFDALTMVQRGHIEAKTMTGSWAGAMGQAQFMPSSYLKYAVDFDGDERRDIWRSTPDALASIANYLKGFGWDDEETWGREVRVSDRVAAKIAAAVPKRPEGCYAIRNMTERRPLEAWTALGVVDVDGTPLPKADVDAGLVDVGERTFLVYDNYDAILGYNCAHYYALSVALLADRFR
jgi:membrane-bound lytic murein transglycosylase B